MGFSQELLELVVLGFKLSKLGSVGRLHAAKAGAPLIEGWLAKATGPAKFLDGHARVSLFEEANDLLIGKSGLFHSRYSPKLADFVPSLWYGREGAGHNYGRLIQHLFATFVAVLPSLSLGSSADQISITQARIEHESGRAILIDIRESSEHQTGVAKNAVLLPMSQLLQKQSIIQKSSNKPILLICNTQNRSKVILAKLKNQGYQNIQYVDGGMSEWAAKGWPMVKP